MQKPALEVHHQKIQHAKSQLEENQGKTIMSDKITEWALLDIADRLLGTQQHLGRIQEILERQLDLKAAK